MLVNLNVRVQKELRTEIKMVAVKENKTLTEVTIEAINEYLKKNKQILPTSNN